ncbi:MAG TPA: hypothetical protein VFS40_09140 [Gemmatimonadales bacterium]|nr:hypothetical protein [Gemmatimonadales bacterium]
MFGFGNSRSRRRNNSTFSNSNLGKAALAGAGILAYRWWKGRQANRGAGSSTAGTSDFGATSGAGTSARDFSGV